MAENIRIKLLILSDHPVAEAVLALQQQSYQVEADLMGVPDLPPMRESLADLKASDETFWGAYDGPELVGLLATETHPGHTLISRLAVSPPHFRRGIGAKLLRHALAMAGPDETMRVSTGAVNEPAIALYRQHGFEPETAREVAPGIHVLPLTRRATP